MSNQLPEVFETTEFVYVLKKKEIQVTEQNFHQEVQSGSVIGTSAIESLLR